MCHKGKLAGNLLSFVERIVSLSDVETVSVSSRLRSVFRWHSVYFSHSSKVTSGLRVHGHTTL